MKKIFVAPEMSVTELEPQGVFAVSNYYNIVGGGENSRWYGLTNQVLEDYDDDE